MKKLATRLALLGLGFPIFGLATSPAPTVNLGYATYAGVPFLDVRSNTTNTQFLGVRYAAPPTASLRFAAPQAPAHTPGVQVAGSEPARCFEAGMGVQAATPFRVGGSGLNSSRRTNSQQKRRGDPTSIPGFSEDCLFLNVYVPGSLGERKGLPVVVWIHGGGYVSGSASGFQGTDIYDGNDLIRDATRNVIAVVIQYRLGIFGFLPGQKVKDEGALNAGLLDQQFALKWVQQHITKFGGDPTQVTIWGQSAGAGSVIQHVVANGGKTNPPLFRGAITSSTYLPSQYRFNDRVPEMLFSEVVSQSNCSSAEDALTCLRAADVNTLQAANTDINSSGFFGTFVFVPVVDGTLITDRPSVLLREGRVNGEILYSVTNTFEGTGFVDATTAGTVTTPNYLAQLFPNLIQTQIAAGSSVYAKAGLTTNLGQAIAIMGESIFICPTYFMLRAFGGNGFKGEFAIPPGGHGMDVAYYFTSQNANGIPGFANPTFDKAFAESFLDFAMALNTNDKRDPTNVTPSWPLWEGSNEMLFNKTEAGAPDIRVFKTLSALLERCAFWESVSEMTAQ